MPRTILHLDLDAFYCAVEEQLNPALRGLPFAVGGSPDRRGVVASCSYAARQYGVRSALPMSQAVRLCPHLKIVPAKFDAYRSMSRKVMAILHDVTPLVEQLSIDEAFMDVTALAHPGEQIARSVQETIQQQLDLPSSLGVAENKLLAKIANNRGKSRIQTGHPPCSIEVIPPGSGATYLASLPVRELWGVGPRTAERLEKLNIHTIGDIASQSEYALQHHFGKHGRDMWHRAHGIDNRPVVTEHDTQSVSSETTFSQDVRDQQKLLQTLHHLACEAGKRLRRQNLSGRTIFIKLRWSDFTTLTRQITLSQPVARDDDIYHQAALLFERNWHNQSVRLLGVGISNLSETVKQLTLWDAMRAQEYPALNPALEDLRARFGDEIIQRGSDLSQDTDT